MKILGKDFSRSRLCLIAFSIAGQFVTYYVPKIVNGLAPAGLLDIPLDARIPFVPFFILFYVLAFPQWVLNYYLLADEEDRLFRRFLWTEIAGKFICMIFFLVMPTRMVRPEVTGQDFFSRITAIIYFFDEPNNLFPSMHCLLSWCDMRAALACRKLPRWIKGVSVVFTFGVLAATVLVKQHVILDCAAGVALAELCLAAVTLVQHRKEKNTATGNSFAGEGK